MILSDKQIERAIRDGKIIIAPAVDRGQYQSSSLDLRVGDDFLMWKEALGAKHTTHSVDLDNVELSELTEFAKKLELVKGFIEIPPKAFVIVRALEHVTLPPTSKLAARVEGRSKQARLGMTAHLTAPTIHAGFSGKITLEIINFGPFELKVRPNETKLCQLIFEAVGGVPRNTGSKTFKEQATPLGTPKRK